jgi:hypothetical protein
MMSPLSSPSFSPFAGVAALKRRGAPPWRHHDATLCATASWPSTCPCAPAALSSRRRSPPGSPNPSRLRGKSSPVHTTRSLEKKKGEGREKGEEDQRPPEGASFAAKPRAAHEEEPDPPSPSARASSTSSPPCHCHLHPRRQARATPLHQRLLRPMATKVSISFPTPLRMPRPSSRGGTCRSHRAAVPPSLVMPAFVPGVGEFKKSCHPRNIELYEIHEMSF